MILGNLIRYGKIFLLKPSTLNKKHVLNLPQLIEQFTRPSNKMLHLFLYSFEFMSGKQIQCRLDLRNSSIYNRSVRLVACKAGGSGNMHLMGANDMPERCVNMQTCGFRSFVPKLWPNIQTHSMFIASKLICKFPAPILQSHFPVRIHQTSGDN